MSFYKAGIDIGSTTIKFVVMDENNNICFKDYRRHLSNIQETLLGLVKGSDTLQLIVGKDDAKIESNVIDFAIVTKPYVKELYTGGSAVVREGEE